VKIAYLTSGAAGMLCGSCLHDNTLAREMLALGADVQLIPLYTPIRTDEVDVSQKPIFFGGINVYLQQHFPLARHLPRWLTRWLDQPWIIRLASQRSIQISARELGSLTVSMLKGKEGFQGQEVERLADWLSGDLKPDVLIFSNMLTAGCVPAIKEKMSVKVLVTLQGDDIFLQDLVEPYKQQALTEMRRLCQSIDGFLVHSDYYARHMQEILQVGPEKFRVQPLGIDAKELSAGAADIALSSNTLSLPTIGYLARLAPEKGLHVLADAFVILKQMPGMEQAKLRVAGWLGKQHEEYATKILERLKHETPAGSIDHVGEVSRQGKIDFLRSLDVLSVPTTYREPKGLFVLEALASGVPVVVPDHGAFPEMLRAVGGGELCRPNDPQHLAEVLAEVLRNREQSKSRALLAQEQILATRSGSAMAAETLALLRTFAT
jgi:glycosyltransferase involved in cell wall biosynthesis